MLKFVVRTGILIGAGLTVAGSVLLAQEKHPEQGKAGMTSKSVLQAGDVLKYVNPFIGTAKSDVQTIWGSEGGTYPGAVAPWGYIQLTPETMGGGGYDYTDSSIQWFSCVHHMSGYPAGSAGEIKVMPLGPEGAGHPRAFRHIDEKAEPGYYRVIFNDNNTITEAAVSERAGIFRFIFPEGVAPKIFLAGVGGFVSKGDSMGKEVFRMEGAGVSAAFRFGVQPVSREVRADGVVFGFDASAKGSRVILLKTGISAVGGESAERNMEVDLGRKSFEELRAGTAAAWRKELSVIGIDEGLDEADRLNKEESNNRIRIHKVRSNDIGEDVSLKKKKTIFYTALYHAMLLPWIISDADGNYRGRDGQIHRTTGKNEYGGFSPWDTYRTLHPLLCLLFPGRQHDMILSMLDVYRQTGHLPADPMTGNHAIPVIVDSWLKGIRGFDVALAYAAMRKDLMEAPFQQADRETFRDLGYIPSTFPESVTRTVEYAYDDWVLSRMARSGFMGRGEEGGKPVAAGKGQASGGDGKRYELARDEEELERRSFSYRQLFDPASLFFLPRNGNSYNQQPGNSGYKEGDKWVYSYSVPQHPQDLINLMGGSEAFTARLDSVFRTSRVLFDNETVFHMPYLFNYAGRPDKSQEWVKRIRDGRFGVTPGGLPGNDDLGSMSSWYVFSALGIYPFCPGRPVYDIGTPFFRSITLHLANGKQWVIKKVEEKTGGQGQYVRSLRVNNSLYRKLTITHAMIGQGGVLEFVMGDKAGIGMERALSKEPDFVYSRYYIIKKKVAPNELSWVHFSIANKGAVGVKIIRLLVNGREYGRMNCLVSAGAAINDSIPFRLYAFGSCELRLEGLPALKMIVASEEGAEATGLRKDENNAAISDLVVRPLIPAGEMQSISFNAQNIGGSSRVFPLILYRNDSIVWEGNQLLKPGEKRNISFALPAGGTGMQTIRVKDKKERFKVYDSRMGSVVLDLRMDKVSGDTLIGDESGFGNGGRILGNLKAMSNGSIEARDSLKATAVGSVGTTDGLKGAFLFDRNRYLEVGNTPSLDNLGETITMMVWVYQTERGGGLVDLFTKGDNHVLQIIDNKKLGFFAGGWGRGDCGVDLPENWLGHWHHIAGVCEGNRLFVYIDGILKGEAAVQGRVNLSGSNKWTFGRNEEFPGQRIFTGYLDRMRVYMEPLTGAEIFTIIKQDRDELPLLKN